MSPKESKQGTCACGCGEPVARMFRPGHDARLAGRLTTLGVTDRDAALEQAKPFGEKFTAKVERGIESRLTKATKRNEPAPQTTDGDPFAHQVTAKVGRWMYDGIVTGEGHFEYVNKQGATVATERFEVIR